ncbi:MAG: hypothetical protein QXM12_03150 [Nitrososphaerota archaeon]
MSYILEDIDVAVVNNDKMYVDFEYLRDICVGAVDAFDESDIKTLRSEGIDTASKFITFVLCDIYSEVTGESCSETEFEELRSEVLKLMKVNNPHMNECLKVVEEAGFPNDK